MEKKAYTWNKRKEYSRKSVERVLGRHKNNNKEQKQEGLFWCHRIRNEGVLVRCGYQDVVPRLCVGRKNSRQQSKEAVEHLFRLVGKEGNSTKKRNHGEVWF
nr:hypothetical protein [Tanacetum cinerariifolium]